MCIACPARVLSKKGERASIVDAHGRERDVNCPIDAQPGECVLIGMGFAIEKISSEKYEEIAEAYRQVS